MDKTAQQNTNAMIPTGIPILDKINARRFTEALMIGALGGGGIATAAGLLRQFREALKSRNGGEDTDDETIVLNLPQKAAAANHVNGAETVSGPRPVERKVVQTNANGTTQFRSDGKYGKGIRKEVTDGTVKKEGQAAPAPAPGNPGPHTVATIVANTLGMTATGLLSYEVVSRLFDRLNERRLKKKLEAAQQAYVNALQGVSKRAEAVNRVLALGELLVSHDPLQKEAKNRLGELFDWATDQLPGAVTAPVQYGLAGYILALLAGTGASAYVTKKVMDREFPEEKLKKDINRPTRIVFRTVGGEPKLAEYADDLEKEASGETCAALTAMLPIYMDLVEGQPARTLADPYVKIAADLGTDPAGLLKAAADDMWKVYMTVLRNPRALWDILRRTRFGLDMSQRRVASILKADHPQVFRDAVGAMRQYAPNAYQKAVTNAIDAHFANTPNAGWGTRALNAIGRRAAHFAANNGYRDTLVDMMLPKVPAAPAPQAKAAEDGSILGSSYLASVIRPDKGDGEKAEKPDPKDVLAKAKALVRSRRRVTVTGADANAKAYLNENKAAIRAILARLNAQGTI